MVEADTRFTDEPEPGKTTEEKIKPRTVGIIMLIIALFAPIAVNISNNSWSGLYLSLLSPLFMINYSTHEGFYINPTIYLPWGIDFYYLLPTMMLMITMILSVYAGPRLVFSYQLVRLYKGRTTRRRALVLGFVVDCYFLFLTIPTLISMQAYPEYFYIILPIPIALFIALILLKFRPPPVVITPWKELGEPDKWWEKKEAAPTVPTPTRTESAEVKADEKKPSTAKDGSWWEEEEKDKKSDKAPTSPW